MTPPDTDRDRENLVQNLIRQAHERGRTSAERSPFWREGSLRCELHKGQEADRLKVFDGERCVHEESVQGSDRADVRCRELRRTMLRAEPGRGKDRQAS